MLWNLNFQGISRLPPVYIPLGSSVSHDPTSHILLSIWMFRVPSHLWLLCMLLPLPGTFCPNLHVSSSVLAPSYPSFRYQTNSPFIWEAFAGYLSLDRCPMPCIGHVLLSCLCHTQILSYFIATVPNYLPSHRLWKARAMLISLIIIF